MTVITLNQIKTFLGIEDSASDAKLTAILPAVDAKVKEITGRQWSDVLRATIDGTKYAEIRSLGTDPFTDTYPANSDSIGVGWRHDTIGEYLKAGTEITGDGIAADTYIANVFSHRYKVSSKTYAAPSVELSNAATSSGTVDVVLGFNRAYHNIVAKLAWWMTEGQSTDMLDAGISSRSMGPVSVSYSGEASKIDGRFGVPRWAVLGLPRYGSGH